MEQLIQAAANNGIWSLLSIFLLFYVLQDSSKREEKYETREKEYILTIRENQNINKELARRLATIDIMHKDISDIKNKLNK